MTLGILEEYLRAFKGCVMVVSHDRYFVDKVADHLLVFCGGGEVKDFTGTYSEYVAWKREYEAARHAQEAQARPKPQAVRTQAAFYPHFLEPRLAPGEELTPTELQILHLLCADKSNAEIAQIMDVKLPTVKTHVSHILYKLDVKRRAEARTAAKKLRLIPDDL